MNRSLTKSLFRRALPITGLALLTAFPAHAVIFSFTGVLTNVEDPGNLLPPEVVLGTSFSGTIFYDAAEASTDALPAFPTRGEYDFNNPDGSDFSFTLNLGGHAWTANPTPTGPFNSIFVWNNHVTENDGLNYLSYDFSYDETASLPNGITAMELELRFRDNTATALSSDALPSLVPSLSTFSGSAALQFFGDDGMGNAFTVTGSILTVTPVPEPGEWAAMAGGLLGVFAVVRRRLARAR